MKYIPVIGMEIHVELKTQSKMFCACQNDLALGKEVNVNICPICTGQPGTLPVPNAEAIEFVQLAGLILNCQLKEKSKFDRKNYFYPDIPKGYQISQYDQPLCQNGVLNIPNPPVVARLRQSGGKSQASKKVGITRIHLEEDTGKSIHPQGADYSLIDFNRSGVPLMELVTEPDLENGKQARLFCQKLQQIFRYLDISDADMEKGQMRCEVNISLHKKGENKLSGTKVEIKNINSFKFVEKAIDYEIDRQAELLEKGEKIIQETRGFDSVRGITFSQRSKESAHDYRYFPEPDIPPLAFSKEYLEALRQKLPEMPEAKKRRLIEEYNISPENAEIIVGDKSLAEYFENVASEIKEKITCQEFSVPLEKALTLSANYMVGELRRYLMKSGEEIKNIKITPENYAELVAIVASGKINSSATQIVLEDMYRTGGDPSQIIEAKNLMQISDAEELEKVVDEVLAKNAKSAADYMAGKENALKFLIGQVMVITKGRANPKLVIDLLKKKIN